MSNTKHTPGPWTAYNENSEYPGIEGATESVVIWGEKGEQEGVRGDTHARRLANARLIAAAPDMCAALIRALNDFENIRRNLNTDDNETREDKCLASMGIINEVLTKVEGKQ
jgi:hypothetical protein